MMLGLGRLRLSMLLVRQLYDFWWTWLTRIEGHKQEVDRNFGFWSICALSVCADNAWAAGGGSMVVAFYNGGAPGIIYEL